MAVLGSSAMLFFTYFHPHGRVLWLPLQWNVLFIAINSYRIGRVLFDRYMADKLSGEMKVFREEHLNLVDVVDYYKLMKIATEEVFEEGDLVLHQVSMRDLLCVGATCSGECDFFHVVICLSQNQAHSTFCFPHRDKPIPTFA